MNYSVELITPAEDEPVTLAELKTHLRIVDTSEDDLLSDLIVTAREMFETETGRAVGPSTWKQHLPTWGPCDRWPGIYWWNGPVRYGVPTIRLARSPVTAVASVTYYDTDDTLQTFEDWGADLTGLIALVYPTTGSWPAVSTSRPRPITIEFTAGWTSVPSMAKTGIKLLAGHFYNQREAYTTDKMNEVPQGWCRICDAFRTCMGGV